MSNWKSLPLANRRQAAGYRNFSCCQHLASQGQDETSRVLQPKRLREALNSCRSNRSSVFWWLARLAQGWNRKSPSTSFLRSEIWGWNSSHMHFQTRSFLGREINHYQWWRQWCCSPDCTVAQPATASDPRHNTNNNPTAGTSDWTRCTVIESSI